MSNLSGFAAIVSLMHRIIDSGAKFPKVRLDAAGSPIVLSVAGAKSRNAGSVNLTDGGSYGNNVWYGLITTDGEFRPSQSARTMNADAKAALWSLMVRMRNGEAEEVFAEHGKKFGNCCMCGKTLTNPESVELGIGPICRERGFG